MPTHTAPQHRHTPTMALHHLQQRVRPAQQQQQGSRCHRCRVSASSNRAPPSRLQRHQQEEEQQQQQQQEHHAQLGWQQQQQAAAAPACDRRAAPPALLRGDGTGATTRMMMDVAAACSTPGAGVGVALLAIALCSTHAGGADAAVAAHAPAGASSSLMDLAEGEEFWGNVAKYGRYFVTVMLGTGYVMVQPLLAAFKRPVTAVAALGALVGGFLLLRLVLNAMLGLQDLPLEPYPWA